MTHKTDDRVSEIKRRVNRLQQKRDHRVSYLLKVTCTGLCLCLLTLLAQSDMSGYPIVFKGYSSVLLHDGSGAYILVGIVTFMMGVAVTLLCLRSQRQKNSIREKEPDYLEMREDEK